jgi:hypothetical protein
LKEKIEASERILGSRKFLEGSKKFIEGSKKALESKRII